MKQGIFNIGERRGILIIIGILLIILALIFSFKHLNNDCTTSKQQIEATDSISQQLRNQIKKHNKSNSSTKKNRKKKNVKKKITQYIDRDPLEEHIPIKKDLINDNK